MSTVLASDILSKASILLQDTTNIRWPQTELLGWLNDGTREIVAARPDQQAKLISVPLVAGTKQTIPTDGIELLQITRNMGVGGAAPGMALRKVPQNILDSQVPGWHTLAAVPTVRHYMYDPRSPHTFYVYPPADGTTQIEMLYAAAPAPLTSVTQTIAIDDIYANILLDYVMFRAYSKDLEDAGNTDRAQLYLKVFTDALGAKTAADAAMRAPDQVKG